MRLSMVSVELDECRSTWYCDKEFSMHSLRQI